MRRALAIAAVAGALLGALPATAHEVLHAVERGRAIALRAYFSDGEPMAYAEYQLFSPADPRVPHQKGRTDRNGWLAFVPDAAGRWHVRIVEASGHGLETDVEASAEPAGAANRSDCTLAAAAFILRPLVGIAGIGAVFAALFVFYRRRGAA